MALKRGWLILLILGAVYFLTFSALSVLKHRSFHSTYLDLGLEAQSVWNTSQGRPLRVSFGENGEEISALSYHVSPVVAFLAPLYRVWPTVELLLIIQTLILTLGAVPLYLLAKDLLKSRLLPLIVVISYFLSPSLQWSNLNDFHPQTLATTPLLFLFWFYYRKKWFWFFLMLVLSLLIKENIALVTAVFGLLIIFSKIKPSFEKRETLIGLAVFILSLFWFLSAVYLIMPFFSGGAMGALGRYEYLGRTPGEIIFRLATDWNLDLKILLVPAKIKYLFHLLVSAGFFSLLSPFYLLPAATELILNLFSAYNPQWQVKFHYTAAITPFIYISAIYGMKRCRTFLAKKSFVAPVSEIIIAFYLVAISLLWNYAHSPSPLAKDFDSSIYKVADNDVQRERVLRSLPVSASVSAMNNLGAHLANRRYLWRFPIGIEKSDFIVVDPTLPGTNFDLSQIGAGEFDKIWGPLLTDQRYEIFFQSKNLFILKRNSLLN
ncbi:MAG: DUF2079 domain-containing protein [Patescibacteria group bacterium]